MGKSTHLKRVVKHIAQPIAKSHFTMGIILEEFEIVSTAIKRILDTVFQIIFGKIDVIRQVRKTNLWFDHPKLRQMTSRVRILRAECGAEGVHVRKCASMCLNVELTRHRQIGSATEKVLVVINSTSDLDVVRFVGVFVLRGLLRSLSQTFLLTFRDFLLRIFRLTVIGRREKRIT